MKNAIYNLRYKLTLLIILISTGYIALAQESGGSTGSSTSSSSTTTSVSVSGPGKDWYTQPWVWIVGAALFILLLVALLGNNRRSTNRVRVTRTVRRDTDTDLA